MPRAPEHVSDATLRLLLADGIGPITLRKLRERFDGDDERVAAASIAELDEVDGIGRDSAAAIRRAIDSADCAAERRSMRERGVGLILIDDPDYPALLKTIADAPAALWMRGDIDPQRDRLTLAIVGSRKCSAYGREQAARFATLLTQNGLTIVSGGALGIDGESHRAAMRVGGRTIAVAGCGLATDYPVEHAELFARIAGGGGAIVSEFPMATPPAAGNFPRRNRIISGLSLGVLVIEAAQRSGALITARVAAEEHHREVMALPGRVDSPASAGCLRAIREGWAALVTSHADVLEQLDSSGQMLRDVLMTAPDRGVEARRSATLFDGNLTPGQQSIVRALTEAGGEGLIAEQIATAAQLPLSQVMADLTLLQIRGRVTRDWTGSVRLKGGGSERT